MSLIPSRKVLATRGSGRVVPRKSEHCGPKFPIYAWSAKLNSLRMAIYERAASAGYWMAID